MMGVQMCAGPSFTGHAGVLRAVASSCHRVPVSQSKKTIIEPMTKKAAESWNFVLQRRLFADALLPLLRPQQHRQSRKQRQRVGAQSGQENAHSTSKPRSNLGTYNQPIIRELPAFAGLGVIGLNMDVSHSDESCHPAASAADPRCLHILLQ